MKKLFVFCLIICLFSGSALAGGFINSTIKVPGKIMEVVSVDVNDDSRLDIIVSYQKGVGKAATGRLAVFFAKDSGYVATPDIDKGFPVDTCLFDLGDLTGDGKLEAVVFRKWSIQGCTLDPEKGAGDWETVLKRGSGVMFPNDEGRVPYEDLVRNWMGDKSSLLALPDYGKLRFYELTEAGSLEEKFTLELDVRGSLQTAGTQAAGMRGFQIKSGVTMPSLFVGPEKDGVRSLVATDREMVRFHAGTEKGFSVKGKAQRFSIVTEQEHRDGNMNLRTFLMDLDGDGKNDLIFNKFGGSLTKYRSEVKIFKGQEGGFATQPSYVTNIEGFTPLLQFWDIDNDGRMEMALPEVEIGLAQAARVLMTKSAKVTFQVFKGKTDGFFGDKPDLIRKITYKVETEPVFRFLGFMPDFSGDFDGDGVADMVMSYGKGLGVWKNKGGLSFGGDPDLSSGLEVTESYRIADMDGDGKSDIYIWDPVNPDSQGAIEILMNRTDK